jgi:hypothetical protein
MANMQAITEMLNNMMFTFRERIKADIEPLFRKISQVIIHSSVSVPGAATPAGFGLALHCEHLATLTLQGDTSEKRMRPHIWGSRRPLSTSLLGTASVFPPAARGKP